MTEILIKLDSVSFSYPGQALSLEKVGLELNGGERLCISGANGAGKSTLLHLIVGLLKPTAGHIHVFGKERQKETDFHEVRRLVGLVFQDPDDQLFCPTVLEDIAFGPLNLGKSKDEAIAIVEDILECFQLSHLKDRVTHRLSGGEKRLVTLAAVLAMKPRILLLDEPTNALDEATTERLVDILMHLSQAMILVSHDPHFRGKVATRSLTLEGGKLKSFDPKCRHAKG